MIILDTDVISALMKPTPDPRVVAWLDGQDARLFWTTAVTIYEIRLGIAVLPIGRRREELEIAFERALDHVVGRQVYPLDVDAALMAGSMFGARFAVGVNTGIADTLIAGIVRSTGSTLATGNMKDFRDLGSRVVNPWSIGLARP